jgi:hypothetical protein
MTTPAKTNGKKQEKQKKPGTRMVAQPHGGAIYQGAPANPVPGTGRPPSFLRDRLTGSFEQRVEVLEAIADGLAVEEFETDFASILPHVKCPKCETQMQASHPKAQAMLTIRGKRTARPGDRIKAIDTIGKYGPGQKIENVMTVVSPEVVGRLNQTLRVIASRDTWNANDLINRLEEVWK